MTKINKNTNILGGISSVIDSFQPYNKSVLVPDGEKGVIGTSNPYQFNLYSDLITNPSSVSISEFQKMAYTQPIIAAGLTIINNLVINEVGRFQHENKVYEDFINNMINNFDISFDNVLKDMLTALWAGFSVGEKKYGSDGRYITVTAIEPRPAQSIIYRVDSQGHLKDDGIIQYYFNNLWTGYGNLLAFNQVNTQTGEQIPNPYASRGDFDYPWRTVWAQPIGTVIIPRDKCIHFTYRGLDGLTSPYGRSLLRSAYDAYVARTEMTRITLNAANFKASPIPTITIDPQQMNTEDGDDVMESIANALSNLGHAGDGNNFLLLKGTKESISIGSLSTTASLSDIIEINNYWDKMLLTAILFPGELAGLSDKGSYALGKTQQDLLGRNIAAISTSLKETLIQQLVKPLLQVNFNEQENFGVFVVADNVAEDVALNMDKLGTLHNEGIKLKPEAIVEMLDLNYESVESTGNPVMENETFDNSGLNSNFTRAGRLGNH